MKFVKKHARFLAQIYEDYTIDELTELDEFHKEYSDEIHRILINKIIQKAKEND